MSTIIVEKDIPPEFTEKFEDIVSHFYVVHNLNYSVNLILLQESS